jgi:hypothetical protein
VPTEQDFINPSGNIRTVLIFEASSGRIVHVHHVGALPGASLPGDEVILAEAVSKAGRLRDLAVSDLDAVFVTQPLDPKIRYRVDLDTRVPVIAEEKK